MEEASRDHHQSLQTGDRDVPRSLADVAFASPLFVFAPLCRHWHLRWGATAEEVAAQMPGDDLVPVTSFNATRAITIDAPPDAVWPWLVQIGNGRAGFYSYDLFDNAARPSASEILPEYQDVHVGDWVPMASTVSETTAFKVKGFEPNHWLLWEKPHSTWSWKLVPLAGGRTRLITRLKDRYEWRAAPANALLSLILFEFADFPMMRRLLLNVKRRAEHLGAEQTPARPPRPLLGLRDQPGRLALALMRLPRPLYHRGYGWMLDHTFLLIVHPGRKTGKPHETVAMALAYDPDTRETVVCSAWGAKTEWIRNLRAHPALQITIGRESYVPQQRFLSADESFDVACGFQRRHPWRTRLFAAILGWGDLSSEREVREFVRSRPFVSFRPAGEVPAKTPGHS